jgi:quinol monooxygenase YgiN
MPELTIVAHIRAVPERIDRVRTELEKLVAPTRAEPGCLRYDLHRDNEDPAHFLFYETWESRDLWRAHMESRHLADFRGATEGAVESLVIHEMTRIG